MARMGMDVDAVEEASRALKAKGAELGAIVAAIEQVVRQLPGSWLGKDATDFVNNWWPGHKNQLLKLRADIEGLGQSAWNNAQEQRATSDAGSGARSKAADVLTGHSDGGRRESLGLGLGAAGKRVIENAMRSMPRSPGPGELPHWDEAAYREFETRSTMVRDPRGDYPVDGNGKAADNCTAWVAWRREQLGMGEAPFGHGGQMAFNAGGSRDTPPSLGAIVSDTTEPEYGHVMIIEKINPDGSFVISETNYARSSAIHTRTWTPTPDGKWRSESGIVSDLVIAT